MTEIQAPKASVQYLTEPQRKLVDALIERDLSPVAYAYEAGVKFVYLIKNPDALNGEFISNSAAACVIAHLSREIINFLMRQFKNSDKMEYDKIFDRLVELWGGYSFSIDGQIPEYNTEVAVEDGDVIFPSPPISIVCEGLHEHFEHSQAREDQATLLLRDIYGDRSEENPLLKDKLKWLRKNELTGYAHLNPKVHGEKNSEYLDKIIGEFTSLEVLLMEYSKRFYDRVDDINDLLSKANQ